MTTPTHYTMFLAYAGNTLHTYDYPESVDSKITNSPYEPEDWTIVTHYADSRATAMNGRDWQNRNTAPAYRIEDEEPEDLRIERERNERNEAALKRYNERYDNTLYAQACYSLPTRTQDEWSHVRACVAVSNIALRLCGAQTFGTITFDIVTTATVRFWSAFTDTYNDPHELPF